MLHQQLERSSVFLDPEPERVLRLQPAQSLNQWRNQQAMILSAHSIIFPHGFVVTTERPGFQDNWSNGYLVPDGYRSTGTIRSRTCSSRWNEGSCNHAKVS